MLPRTIRQRSQTRLIHRLETQTCCNFFAFPQGFCDVSMKFRSSVLRKLCDYTCV